MRDDDRFCRKCGRLNYWGKDGLVCVRCGIVPEEDPVLPLEEKPSGGSTYFIMDDASFLAGDQIVTKPSCSYIVDIEWHNANAWHTSHSSRCYTTCAEIIK